MTAESDDVDDALRRTFHRSGPNAPSRSPVPREPHPASSLAGRHIHVGVDVSSGPLWEDGGNVPTEDYPISETLTSKLDDWAEQYNHFWDMWGTMTATADQLSAYDAEGTSLAEDLARELGAGYVVHFDSVVSGESEVVFLGGSAERLPRH